MNVTQKIKAVVDQLNTVMVGKSVQVQDGVCCLLAGGHLLIEDVPGVGKTLLARAFARALHGAAAARRRARYSSTPPGSSTQLPSPNSA